MYSVPINDNSPSTQYAEGRQWDDFGVWLQFGKGIYWVNGKAGSGKSTLMKYIVSHNKTASLLRTWAGDSKLCTGGFFFWNSGSKQQRCQVGLFRSLLHEILGQHPELILIVLHAQWGVRYSAKCQAQHCPVSSFFYFPIRFHGARKERHSKAPSLRVH